MARVIVLLALASATAPANRQPHRESLAEMHQRNVREFTMREGFGLLRVGPSYRLIGLWSNETGRIYERGTSAMKRLHRAKSSPLDWIDLRAVDQLSRGREIVLASGRAYGAIRAAASCLECHAVDPGTLLGAFRYELSDEVLDRAVEVAGVDRGE